MRRIVLSILIVIMSISIMGCSKKEKSKEELENEIKIVLYKVGTEEIIKEIKINDDDGINVLNEYLSKIEPLKPEEQVDLALAQEISIIYNDNVSVGIQKEEKDYCYYINKENNVSSLSKIPSGMYDYVLKNIENAN